MVGFAVGPLRGKTLDNPVRLAPDFTFQFGRFGVQTGRIFGQVSNLVLLVLSNAGYRDPFDVAWIDMGYRRTVRRALHEDASQSTMPQKGGQGKCKNPWGQSSRHRRWNVQNADLRRPHALQTDDGLAA